MRLIPNAKRIALKSYSMWSIYLGVAVLIIPEILFGWLGIDTDPQVWWLSAMGLFIFGIVGRFIVQEDDFSFGRVLVLSALFIALIFFWSTSAISQTVSDRDFAAEAVPLVAKWEGKENLAYLDRIASPPVWTICHGETRGVKRGDYRTDLQCREMLVAGLLEYREGLHKHFTAMTIAQRLTAKRDAAYVSLAWNVGIYGAGKSTATRRLNAGDLAGGCTALTWWNRAGQRVVRGLVMRRADEYRMCMVGVKP